MPKRNDIKSILIIGAGPIVIGQACEFDYSGTQACRALKEEGYRVILVNSNPATIMTDPEMADATYIEPITPEMVEKIIAREEPDALLPTMGGQTALNCAKALAEKGVLERYGVELIGASLEAINKAEDRSLFNVAMDKIGLEVPRNAIARSLDDAWKALEHTGLPAIIRPSFTMGGAGGGIAYNREEFEAIVRSGLDASPTSEVQIDESILGWKEYEMEVVRDHADNCIIICSIENVDPMGVHTGDSITVAPALTLTDKEYQILRNASIAVLREIGVDTGGSNVQFAVNPEDGRVVVIEMNPRVSRSSALASKATGFPIAKVAAKLAVGYTLDEIANDITGVTPASFEPTIDYVVTKIPRFAFEKFSGTSPLLSSTMKSVGEAMAIGRNFAESLQKALRSLETGLSGLDEVSFAADEDIRALLSQLRPDRLLIVAQAMREGIAIDEIQQITGYDQWFLNQVAAIVALEENIREHGLPEDRIGLLHVKKQGFSDARLGKLAGKTAGEVAALREKLNVLPVYKRIDTCAAEFAAQTSYMYGCYEGDGITEAECEAEISDRKKVMILGGGPNRIGQGIEFDYCCVHAAYALRDAGFETIMVNCNPETVSTDYDTSDRLYFEPLTDEDVIALAKKEQSKGQLLGAIAQFGGQTPLKLASALEDAGIPIIGTSPDAIDLAEDRERFQKLLQELGLKQPKNAICHDVTEAEALAETIGFPLVVRPSYVLGGRAMVIVYDSESLASYVREITSMFGDGPILLDHYLQGATEVDVDALCDGTDVFVGGIMEHVEEAGVHSGDSACTLPPHSLKPEVIAEIERQSVALAKALNVVGLMNVQYAVQDDVVYILEVNPRASRTVPFVAKATGLPLAKIASRLMAGEKLASFNLQRPVYEHIAVKEAVFPFARFPGVDTVLGPEMKSTGEAMGIDKRFALAFAKAQLGSGNQIPQSGTAFVSVKTSDKGEELVDMGRLLNGAGFTVLATSGTANYLKTHGVEVEPVNKVREGRPHIVDRMKDGDVQIVFNTTEGKQSLLDSFSIRQTALTERIPFSTTFAGSYAIVRAIATLHESKGLEVRSLQEYLSVSRGDTKRYSVTA